MDSYLFYLTIFIAILTIALVAQAVILFLVHRRLAQLAERMEKTAARLSEQSARLMDQADQLMAEVKRHVERYGQVGDDISARLHHTVNGVLDSVDRVAQLAASGATTIMREARNAAQGILSALFQLGQRPRQKRLPPPTDKDDLLH